MADRGSGVGSTEPPESGGANSSSPRRRSGSDNRKTVWIALGANAAITVVKAGAGLLSGSSALLAEAAHSVADTSNQGLMLVSISRSEKPPDEEHPFGYGKERFFWTLLAAVVIFLSGGVFSIVEGLFRIVTGGSEEGGFAITYGALGFALIAETTSFVRALRQTRGEAREAGLGFVEFVRVSKEPTVKTVVSEDAAAVAGVVIAFVGTAIHQLTGQRFWDAAAAVAIGVLLCVVGWALARDTKGLLVGEPARPEERERLRETILRHDEVADVLDLRTMYLGPQTLLVAVRLDLRDDVRAGDVERVSSLIEDELHDTLPDVQEVFLDATSASSRSSRPSRAAARR